MLMADPAGNVFYSDDLSRLIRRSCRGLWQLPVCRNAQLTCTQRRTRQRVGVL